ncbi:type VI secretion system baseplate subunit TssE [Inquilinus sp. CAU 1745]|uniref:type VI secretion system baseplate subunit TssE n=1 Tax=Inquilinus sp. CAU 1745 TaxID=3140369 RepID=UPI00325AE9BB
MADLTPQERLQPSLLDRLADDEPGVTQESRDRRVLSVQRLREVVLRDLTWLLNAVNLTAVNDLEDYPEVERSVLNYGLPDMAGHTVSGVDLIELEQLLRRAIIEFEPRILRDTLSVKLLFNESEMNHNAMTFEIQGDLWAQPVPLHMYLRTELDLEIGTVKVSEFAAGRNG